MYSLYFYGGGVLSLWLVTLVRLWHRIPFCGGGKRLAPFERPLGGFPRPAPPNGNRERERERVSEREREREREKRERERESERERERGPYSLCRSWSVCSAVPNASVTLFLFSQHNPAA